MTVYSYSPVHNSTQDIYLPGFLKIMFSLHHSEFKGNATVNQTTTTEVKTSLQNLSLMYTRIEHNFFNTYPDVLLILKLFKACKLSYYSSIHF